MTQIVIEKKKLIEILDDFLEAFEKDYPDHDDYDLLTDDFTEPTFKYDVYIKHINPEGEVELDRMFFLSKDPINIKDIKSLNYGKVRCLQLFNFEDDIE